MPLNITITYFPSTETVGDGKVDMLYSNNNEIFEESVSCLFLEYI